MANKSFRKTLFGWDLYKYMKRNNISIEKLAELAEVSYETARKWRNGESMPNNYSLDILDYKTGMDALKYKDEEWIERMIEMYSEGVEIHEMF